MVITAIIPTRGDVDLSPIITHLRTYPEIGHIVVVASDTPYSRYVWAQKTGAELIYTQDDDCITDIRPLIDAYELGCEIVNAMTPEHAKQYPGAQTLIGFGSIFPVDLIDRTFSAHGWEQDPLFYREADRIFATLNRHKTVFPRIQIMTHANAANRFWMQPDHLRSRQEMNERIFIQTGIEAGCL